MSMSNDDHLLLQDWLKRAQAYKAMYGEAAFFYRVLGACVDVPLIVLPIICSTFNMASDSDTWGSVGFYVINSLVALVSILHGLQKYFDLSKNASDLKGTRANYEAVMYDIQMFMVTSKDGPQDDHDKFIKDVECKMIQYAQMNNIPSWIKRKYVTEISAYDEKVNTFLGSPKPPPPVKTSSEDDDK